VSPSPATSPAPRRLPRPLSIAAVLAVLGPLTAGFAADPATASFSFPKQTLTVPAGFTVELVAGPPVVNRPISIAFDEAGRLYATDSSGLSERAPRQFEEKPHRVVRLEDTDGDGRFDRSTVFADRMMFPQGALFHAGSLYVAAPPQIWKLTDADGDGVAERREVWWDGKTLTGCANDVHGPYLGPDGWFYWTKGAFAEQRHTLGNGAPFVTRAAHIYRARPDGSGFEPVLTGGMDNPVGVAFGPAGERFLCGTFFQIPAAGRRDGLIHAIYGGVYGKENAASAGHTRTGDLMPVMTHLGAAAPCGSTTYRSRGFGEDFTGNLFVCTFNLRKVIRHELIPDGATFRTRDTDFVTSNHPDFRPTDVLEDADGSLLVVDTGGWYKICCPTSQLAKPDVLGGIYRIRRTGAPAPSDPRGRQIDWAALAPTALAAWLADPRPEVVDRAIHELGHQGATAVPAVQRVALTAPEAATRRHALWALARLPGADARRAVREALADRDPSVVQAALHLVSLQRDPAARPQLAKLLAGRHPALARGAAEALGRAGDPGAVPDLIAAAGRLPGTAFSTTGTPEDPAERALEHSLIHALIELGRPDELAAQLPSTPNSRLVRVALVALDQMPDGGLTADAVLPWLKSVVPALRATAGWIVSHRPEWGGALASFFAQRLADPARSETESATLQAQLTDLAKSPAIQYLLASTLTSPSPSARALALRAMAAAGPKETPAPWFEALATLLAGGDRTLLREAVTTTRALPLPKGGHAALSAALARVGRDSALPADVRLDALAAAAPALGTVEPPLFDFLRAHLDGRHPLLLRQAAAATLARAPLSANQRLTLTDAVRTAGALETPLLLPAFERAPTEETGMRLVAALQASAGRSGLRVGQLRPLFAKYPPAVQTAASALFAALNADAARQNARVDELLPAVGRGDVRRGQALFNSPRTACLLCHKVGYAGGLLGPDLTNIGRIRSERELLEAVMYPSATLVRGYEPFTVTTRNRDTHTGIIRRDTADELTLATGPESQVTLARADLAEVQPATVSPMPPGMDVILTPEELADLVAFLKSRT
jgi:putative membrane-bound dehydrogenase-like protein